MGSSYFSNELTHGRVLCLIFPFDFNVVILVIGSFFVLILFLTDGLLVRFHLIHIASSTNETIDIAVENVDTL